MKKSQFLEEILSREVRPSLGCTEPIAIALACAKARSLVGGNVNKIELYISQGIFKNGMDVFIPGSGGLKGNRIAAALGAVGGSHEAGLQVLEGITKEHKEKADKLILDGLVELSCDNRTEPIWIESRIYTSNGIGRVVIQGEHTHIILAEANGKICFTQGMITPDDSYTHMVRALSLSDILESLNELTDKQLGFIRQGIEMNLAAAEFGLKNGKIAKTMTTFASPSQIEGCLPLKTKQAVSAAVEARMSGQNIPVMSSGGSGNQGILATLVPYYTAMFAKTDDKKMLASIALSHLINSHAKAYTGRLSPACGCAISSGIGAAVAVTYQKTGPIEDNIIYAINNVISDMTGMICDGAKVGCISKVTSAVDSALRAASLAVSGIDLLEGSGIGGKDLGTIMKHLESISKEGMKHMDSCLLEILGESSVKKMATV